jgi:Cys-rich protein (TIGR01571 family)
MQLNFCGKQKGPAAASNTFKYMLMLWLVYYVTVQVLEAFTRSYAPQAPNDDSVTIEYSTTYWALYGVSMACEIMFGIYLVVMIIRTRSLIREKYSIREENCVGCEDCCCAVFCNCCVVAQMARHTADYDTYPAACCTKTGLPSHVPGIV